MIKILLAISALNSVFLLIIIFKIYNMANELDDLEAQVAKNAEVDQSAITLLNGLKEALDKAIASGDMGRVKTLSDSLGSSSQSLAEAVVANTPSADPPVDPNA